MRPGAKRYILATLIGLAGLSAPLYAASIVVEAAPGSEGYIETYGKWSDEAIGSAAAGLAPDSGARVLKAENGRLDGQVSFTAVATEEAPWAIDIAWPPTANAAGATAVIKTGTQTKIQGINFTPGAMANTAADQWVRVDVINAEEGNPITVTLQFESVTGAIEKDMPLAVAVDAVRFNTDNLPARSLPTLPESMEVSTDTPEIVDQEDTPFTADPDLTAAQEEEIQDPFEADLEEEEMESPFVEEGSPNLESAVADDPFAETTTDPFAESAETAQADDPFASSADTGTESPFAETAEVDDPFASSEEDVSSPFAGTETAEAQSPFAGTTESGEAQSPFAGTVPTKQIGRTETEQLEMPDQEVAVAIPTPQPVTETPAPVPTMAAPEQPMVELPYLNSIDAGMAEAKSSGKPLLVFFSGDSIVANTIEREMSKPDVAEELEKFVRVRIDYRQNRPVAREYAVHQFPYIVILNEYGYTIGHVLPRRINPKLSEHLSPYTQRFYE